MKEIYVIYTGYYSDVCEHGYFTEEDKAKEYCGYMNQFNPSRWNKYRYYKLEPIDLQETKRKSIPLFSVDTQGWDIKSISGQMVEDIDHLQHYCNDYTEYGLSYDFELHLKFTGLDSVDHARKAAQDLIAMIKEKYQECNDWELTMESFGGYAW